MPPLRLYGVSGVVLLPTRCRDTGEIFRITFDAIDANDNRQIHVARTAPLKLIEGGAPLSSCDLL
jgi:hypothetical protein